MKRTLLICIIFIVISGCSKKTDETSILFKISKTNVGLLTDSTQIKDLKRLFKNDSIIVTNEDDSFVGGINAIQIYSKSGTPLLNILPTDSHDSTATIDYVNIKNSEYKTESNLSTKSYFVDIKSVYSVSEIKNKMNTIEVVVDSIKSTFVFNKKGILSNFDFGMKVTSKQIPDSAKIDAFLKHF